MPKPKKTTKYMAVKTPTVMRSFGLREWSADGAGLAAAGASEVSGVSVFGVMGTWLFPRS
jgi:hypothetical protein